MAERRPSISGVLDIRERREQLSDFICALGGITRLKLVADARALFERIIGTFTPERGRPLWERWARYEYQYGDLEAALKLEKRIAETYASGTCLAYLIVINLGLLRSSS